MKIHLLFPLLALLTGLTPALAQPPDSNQFMPGGPLVAEFQLREHCYGMATATVPADHFIYLFGGNLPPGPTGLIERIDTRNNAVETLKSRVFPRYFSCAATVGDFIYIFGGTTSFDALSGSSSLVERFDLRTEKVTALAPSPENISVTSCAQVGGKIYLARHGKSDLLIYDPATAQWSRSAPSKLLGAPKIAAKDGQIYALSNLGGSVCQAYDIASDTWRDLPDMPSPTSGYDLALCGNSIFVFGELTDMTRVFRFDLEKATWHRLVLTGFSARRLPTACAIEGKIYVLGGKLQQIGNFLNEAQVFDASVLDDCDTTDRKPH